MRTFELTLITILTTAALVACAPGPKQPAPDNRVAFAEQTVGGGWRPEGTAVVCGGGTCPAQVGVLIYARPTLDPVTRARKYALKRCTATLIGPARVLTNAHCLTDGAEGYLILPSGAHHVRGVEFSVYQGQEPNGDAKFSPDLAVLTLDQPVPLISPIPVASGNGADYRRLTAYVGNPTDDENVFRIDRVTCAVRRERRFPISISENPDVLIGFGCTIRHGNSGAPMFADGRVEVQAIVQGLGKRIATATNLRCLPLTNAGPASCVRASDDEIVRRQAAFDRAFSVDLTETPR